VTVAETVGDQQQIGAKHTKKLHNTLQSLQMKCNMLEGICCGDEYANET